MNKSTFNEESEVANMRLSTTANDDTTVTERVDEATPDATTLPETKANPEPDKNKTR